MIEMSFIVFILLCGIFIGFVIGFIVGLTKGAKGIISQMEKRGWDTRFLT